MTDFDATTVQACLTLLSILQCRGSGHLLGSSSRKHLVDLRLAIDKALVTSNHPKPLQDEDEQGEDERRRVASSSMTDVTMRPKTKKPTAGLNHQIQPISELVQTRQRKKRVLIATSAFKELSESDSNTTVMLRTFGSKFVATWFRWKRTMAGVSWLAYVIWLASGLLTLLDLDNQMTWIASLVSFSASFFISVYLTAVMNYKLCLASLRAFDTLFFLLEVALFGFSLWSKLCFSVSRVFASIGLIALLCLSWVFYDTFPVSARKGLKLEMGIGTVGVIMILCLLHAKVPRNTCSYRLDLFQGLVDTDHVSDGMTNISTWSFSLSEICLNRGFTLVVLMLKITYSAIKHPDDCVILKSRVRLVEMVIDSTDDEVIVS